MARFRLRFQLQEVDLPPGETLLGRSADCHLTLDDPLVSRVHAKIVVNGDDATIEDVSSRNGVRINGERINLRAVLHDGDRLRVGTQEFVFHKVAHRRPDTKNTSPLKECASCFTPYPEEMRVCPHCGNVASVECETLSGAIAREREPAWALDLLHELLERALAIGRWDDAEEVLRRASVLLDESSAADPQMTGLEYERFTRCASKVAQACHASHWVWWIMALSKRVGRAPAADVTARLRTVALPNRDEVATLLDSLLERERRQRTGSDAARSASIAALEQWRKELRQ